MRRRRVRVAKAPYGVGQKRVKTPSSEADSLAPCGLKSRRPFVHTRLSSTIVARTIRSASILDRECPIRRPKDHYAKRQLERATQFAAGLSAAVSLMSFFLIRSDEVKLKMWDYIQFAILALLTILHLPLVVFYWARSLRYRELSRRHMRLSKVPIPDLFHSLRAKAQCACECLLNGILLVPAQNSCVSVRIFGAKGEFCYEQALYLLVLLRNYHFLRMVYWSSDFAGMRTRLYARLINVRFGYGFITRCFLARYSFKFIILLYLAIVLLSGVCHYEIGFLNDRESNHEIWDDFWLVAYTQATIGYGVNLSQAFFSQAVIILSCLAGSFMIGLLSTASHESLTLSLAEANLCAELVLGQIRRKQTCAAVVLLQSWWRFMRMRQVHRRDASAIVEFYFRLGKFRALLVARQRVKRGRFEYQIESFDVSVRQEVFALAEYMSPIKASEELVFGTQTHDIIRAEYQISQKLKKLHRTRKLLRMLKPRGADDPQNSEESRQGDATPRSPDKLRILAKAKLEAHRHLKGRLLEFP